MISSKQIKAARMLVDWTQGDLAEATSMHLNAINKIENGIGEPRNITLQRIKKAFENSGVRFRGNHGVELKEDTFETLRFEGPDYVRHLVDDSISVLKSPQDELLCCTPDETLFNKADPKQNERYYKHQQKTGFKERIITRKSYDLFYNRDRNSYRWLPEQNLGTISFSIYGGRMAFTNWSRRESLLIRNKLLTETFQLHFESLWANAQSFDRD
jgi:transcriptional regulator with XRE-family HTH domain